MAEVLERAFADGTYPFRLGGGELRELQRICDAGPMQIYRRLLSGDWHVDDVTESIRLGLLGAARKGRKAKVRDADVLVRPEEAVRLVRDYVDTAGAPFVDPDGETEAEPNVPLPWTYSSLLASQILAFSLMGSKDEPLGAKKQEGEAGPSDRPSRTESSDGAPSSPPSPTKE